MFFLLCSDKYFLLSYSFSVLFNSISLSLLCFPLYLCVFVLLHFCLPVSLTHQHSGSLLLMRNRGSITFATKTHIHCTSGCEPMWRVAGPPFLPPMTLELRSACLLGRCLRHLHKSSAGTNMTKCRPKGVLLLLLHPDRSTEHCSDMCTGYKN
jgi:hypothetical protein